MPMKQVTCTHPRSNLPYPPFATFDSPDSAVTVSLVLALPDLPHALRWKRMAFFPELASRAARTRTRAVDAAFSVS